MDYKRFSLEHFLDEVKDLRLVQMIERAEQEVRWVESISYGVSGAVETRKEGGPEYAASIKSFLFWLRYGRRPFGASGGEYELYRPIAVELVNKKDLKPTVLDQFDSDKSENDSA